MQWWSAFVLWCTIIKRKKGSQSKSKIILEKIKKVNKKVGKQVFGDCKKEKGEQSLGVIRFVTKKIVFLSSRKKFFISQERLDVIRLGWSRKKLEDS